MPIMKQKYTWQCNICNHEYNNYNGGYECEINNEMRYLTCSYRKVKNNILTFHPKYYSMPYDSKMHIISSFTDSMNDVHEMFKYMRETKDEEIIDITDNVREVIYVTGRGDIAVIKDVEKLPKKPIKLQDKVSIGAMIYKVIGIESGYKSAGFLIREEK